MNGKNAEVAFPVFISGGGVMGEHMRKHDWSGTSLGHMEAWPQNLRSTVNLCLNSPFPMMLSYGEELVMIYNDAYSRLIADIHPQAFGSPAKQVWADIWDFIGPEFDKVLKQGQSRWFENQLILLNRQGYSEECYFTFAYSPLFDDKGKINGVLTIGTETSDTVINLRHLNSLGNLSKIIAGKVNIREIYAGTLELLNDNKLDFPFSMLYEIAEDAGSASLFGVTGIQLPHPSAPPMIDFSESGKIGTRNFLTAVRTNKPVSVADVRQRLGDMPSGDWNVPPEEALIYPISYPGKDSPYAVIVIGINPHSRLNEKFRSFISLLLDQVATEISNLASIAERNEIIRQTRENDLFMQEHIKELRLAEEQSAKLGAIVKTSNDAIISKTLEGIITSWNKAAERMFGYSAEEIIGKSILTLIPPDRIDEEPRIIGELKRTGIINHFETQRLTKDKRLIDISLTVSLIKDSKGNVIGVSKIARDITEKKQAERLISESEERLRLAAESAELGTWDMDVTNGRIISNTIDHRIKEFTDFGSRLDRKAFLEIVHPDDRKNTSEAFRQALITGKLSFEARIIRIDQTQLWVRVKGKMIFNDKKRPVRMLGIIMDITEQKDALLKLEENEKRLEITVKERTMELKNRNAELQQQKDFVETMLDASIDIMLVYDKDMRFISFNKACELKYGITREEVLGKTLLEIYPYAAGSSGYKDLQRALKGETIHNPRYRSPVTNLIYEDFLIPLKDHNNEVHSVLVIAHDITDTIQNAEQLKQINSELMKSNRELEQFAYIASHDLQEPLRKIQTFSNLLENNFDNDSARKKYFDKITSSAQRMSDLIKAVLNYSRLTIKREQFEDTDLNEVMDMVMVDFELLILEKKAEIKKDTLPTVKGINLQLNQLFSNLLSNSLKFSQDSPRISITSRFIEGSKLPNLVFAEAGKNYVEIVFKDNGIGFEPQYVEQVFTIFQRLNGRESYEGTGIGLALCKKIMDNHHGHITAKSQPGKGTEFYIYFPA